MKKAWEWTRWTLQIILGSALFSLGFDLFMEPHSFNAGGITGLAQILFNLTDWLSVAAWVALINIPLFLIGGLRIGKKFFFGSLLGMASITVTLELFLLLPVPPTEPLLACIYGGVITGVGLGMVFVTGASTGGSDIICRLLKRRWRNIPIGTITMGFDLVVMVLTGIAFGDLSKALYTGLAVFLAGKVIDLVIYHFDNSRVAMVISQHNEVIAKAIMEKLERGVTYLHGEGAYSHRSMKVILVAIKSHQLADLKELVTQVDPEAFVIVQEAHQVLGDGFARYSKDSLQ
jgi:uncharacterized membrane-anchored protein YitT (DUF2179 family)